MFGPVSGSQAPLKDTRYVAGVHCLRVPRDTCRLSAYPIHSSGKGGARAARYKDDEEKDSREAKS